MRLNSYDEWSPLKEIIVGSAANYSWHERELSFELFFYDQISNQKSFHDRMYYPHLEAPSGDVDDKPQSGRSPIKRRYVEELNEDVEGLVDILKSLGVTVHRPLSVEGSMEVRTPAWPAAVVPPLNIRDNTLILGDEIIETPPQVRSRYFETQFLTPVFNDYFRQGARWTVMPRPLMTDSSFDPSYVNGGPVEFIAHPKPSPYDVGFEMMFDGAQCVRLGKDLLVNIATANHAMACDWLERHLEGRITIHRVHGLADGHVDSMVLALRPGLLLVRTPAVVDSLPEPLQKWDMIFPPEPDANNFPAYENDDLILTSPYIDLNILSISPDTVMINEANMELIRAMEGHGFTVVPFRHRHRRIFGGGLHCFTLDTVREGSVAESYLG
ncbi:glycine amidinotransferase [Streptomyces sp. PRKS01-29]|nr:glycine amidinotransferase [Streptomyces sabulosicollis]MBI0293375.1 glycine amidinotransferase [Streptomyces sabulosicollis]